MLCDFCNIWIFESTLHMIIQKKCEKRSVEKNEIILFALPSNSKFITILKTAKHQFLKLKVSLFLSNTETYFNATNIIDQLGNVSKTYTG